MKRRDFLSTSAGLGVLSLMHGPAKANAAGLANQQLLQWIKVRMHVGPKRKRFTDFVRDAAVPAMNRAGIKTVGVFTGKYGPDQSTLFLLLPHDSLESVIMLSSRLLDDAEFRKSGSGIVDVPISEAAYVRIESSLMLAFKNMPKVEVPAALLKAESRIYEVRIYESHSAKAGKKKVEMFNDGGEIAIFRKTGMVPVFFAETVIGPIMPNLHYMLVFENMEARDKGWAVFGKDPDWLKLRSDAQYADTVSNITDLILSPAAYSQI